MPAGQGLQRAAARPAHVRGAACSRTSSRSRSRRSRPGSGRSSTRPASTRRSPRVRPTVTGGIDPEAGGDATVWFAFTANDPRATFECAVDGETFSACENPYLASGLALGQHIFRVRAVLVDPNDQTVNVDPTPARWYFTVVEAPDTFIDIGPEAEINGTTARFVFSSTVSGSTFECALEPRPVRPVRQPVRADRPDRRREHPRGPLGHPVRSRRRDAGGVELGRQRQRARDGRSSPVRRPRRRARPRRSCSPRASRPSSSARSTAACSRAARKARRRCPASR